jgi:hypothetical protein
VSILADVIEGPEKGLMAPDVTLWAARQAAEIVGIGALKDPGGGLGEMTPARVLGPP